MRDMEKITGILISVALLAGCTSSSSAAVKETAAAATESEDLYTEYEALYDGRPTASSWSVGVRESYTMKYSDDSVGSYDIDGTLEYTDSASHASQNINANGLESTLEGWYTGGRLYNSYNGVTYYEDMTIDDLKQSMLVPVDPVKIPQSSITDLQKEETDGIVQYTMILSESAAASYFANRYDVYGLNESDSCTVTSGTITQSFDGDGYLVKETSAFAVSVTVSDQKVDVTTSTEMNLLRINSTQVEISSELKQNFASYVSYQDIDTDAIETETEADDSAESTVTDTFKKRLLSRLSYTDQGNGIYDTSFNDSEAYTIDFNNGIFTYSNYSITYVYNWKGDIGAHESCSYDFSTEKGSDGCDDTQISTLKNVKSDLEMELYYCGLSLDDLVKESQ